MMGTRFVLFLAIILVHQSNSAAANFTFPFGDACKEDVCGKGKCVASNNSTFGFECQCEPGWKQARSQDDDSLKFMPCVIPNCTLNYNCAKTPDPAPDKNKANSSIFDPCFWTDCGGGSCNKASFFTHKCECQEGYSNLFNSTAFPCFKQCSLGGDCANLGINIENNTLSSPNNQSPGLADNSGSYAVSLKPIGGFKGFVVTVVMSLALVWKYI